MKQIVVVDRDGTILREPPDKQVDSLEKLEFLPGIITGLHCLVDAGFTLVMATNQDGLGTKRYPSKSFALIQSKMLTLLEGEGIIFERVLVCPHLPKDDCECRKPKTGLMKTYLRKNPIDKQRSFVLGDRETDVEFARNLGLRAVRLTKQKSSAADYITSDALDACRFIARSARSASIHRKTNETDISVEVSLEGTGAYGISTGIRFFDHMLAQLARHSRIDMNIQANGDLDIDEHHTVEDVGIVLGETLRQALGTKRGIDRFGFAAPLDEALAEVTIDLSGRPHASFHCKFQRERVGELPTELVEDFFRAFADGLRATIHVTCRGRNDHHKVEAIFKATAQALKAAVQIDNRTRRLLPTTKGML
jgi:imidazoleglycerol-phosphate dehydratase/histidinol-phosphatase